MTKKKTAAILYGLGEGQLISYRLRRCLEEAGYSVEQDAKRADILIAHSGGIYTLPDKNQAEMILLVGLPHWPNKHLFKSWFSRLSHLEFTLFDIRMTMLNIAYILFSPMKNLRMFKNRDKPIRTGNCKKIILVRNEKDTFLHPAEAFKLASRKKWTAIEAPGTHDDMWENPKFYVNIVEQYT